MFSRANCMYLLSIAFFIMSAILAFGVENHLRLKGDVLARSRGSNQANVLRQSSCNAFTGTSACTAPQEACSYCTITTYTDVTPGTDGGYDLVLPPFSACGNLWTGTCNIKKMCVGLLNPGACLRPPSISVQ